MDPGCDLTCTLLHVGSCKRDRHHQHNTVPRQADKTKLAEPAHRAQGTLRRSQPHPHHGPGMSTANRPAAERHHNFWIQKTRTPPPLSTVYGCHRAASHSLRRAAPQLPRPQLHARATERQKPAAGCAGQCFPINSQGARQRLREPRGRRHLTNTGAPGYLPPRAGPHVQTRRQWLSHASQAAQGLRVCGPGERPKSVHLQPRPR